MLRASELHQDERLEGFFIKPGNVYSRNPKDVLSSNLIIRYDENSLFMRTFNEICDSFTKKDVGRHMGLMSKSCNAAVQRILQMGTLNYSYVKAFHKWITTDEDRYFNKFRRYTLFDLVMDCQEAVRQGGLNPRIPKGELYKLVDYEANGISAIIELI